MRELKRLIIIHLLFFLFVYGIFWMMTGEYFDDRVDDVLTEKLGHIKENIQIVNEYNRMIAYDSYRQIVSDPEVIAIYRQLNEANTDLDRLRKALYEHLKSDYEILEKAGVSQQHFVTPDNRSFLRMHKPEKFGDDLNGIRYTFQRVSQTHAPVEGFEAGRSAHANRYAFPIMGDNGRYLGAFEISFYAEYVEKLIDKITGNHTHILIKKTHMNEKLWKDPSTYEIKYGHSHEDDEHYMQSNLLNAKPHRHDKSDPNHHYHAFTDEHHEVICDKLAEGLPFALQGSHDGRTISAVFIPYHDVKEKQVIGWLASYSDNNPIIEKIVWNLWVTRISFLIGLLLLQYFIFRNMAANYWLEERVKERTREIEEERNLVTTMIDTANSVIAVIQPDGTMSRINRYAENFVGYSQAEVASEPYFWARFLNPETRDKVQEIIAKANQGEIVENFQNSWISRSGEERIFEWSNTLVKKSDGSMNYLFTIGIDVTEHKQMEAKLIEAKEAAEEATKVKGEFLANMSHEIRTPMNAIIGMTALALDGELNEKQRNYVTKVNMAAESLLGIINDILDFSKIEAGKLTLSPDHFQLKEVINHTLHLISVTAREKKLKTRVKIDPDVPKFFYGDSLRLGQVLTNLANNAVKFSHPEGAITLSASLVEESDSDAVVIFSIEDEGIGISKADQKRLFESFSQVDASMARQFGGTGLGLAISQNIVRLMDGEISVESEEGRGSRFSFTIRMPKSSESAIIDATGDDQTRVALTIGKLRGTHILLVEDNVLNQELAVDLLERNGIEVTTANNGLEALEALEHRRFDAVLMDCQMPEMDGYEATRRIRKQERFRDLPILSLTANVMSGDAQRALDAGMNDNIAKPIDPETMFMTMAKWIRRNSREV